MNKELLDLINAAVWFIPFKKKRDNIRKLLIEAFYNIECNSKVKKLDILDKVALLINEELDPNIQKTILKNNLRLVEIETHSYCNRKCWYCPNSIVDRHSSVLEMDENVYLNVIEQLREINYSYTLNFHRFNEPLSKRELIVNRVKQAKKALPNAILGIFSNGDYLTRDYLDELRDSGVSKMTLTYHMTGNECFDKEKVLNTYMKKLLSKLNLNISNILVDNSEKLSALIDYDGIKIVYTAYDIKKMGSTRGGVIEGVKEVSGRSAPCFYPFTDLCIDYNGEVMPCCNLRSDVDTHKKFILGNVQHNSIFEIFTNKNITALRRHLLTNKEKMSPCNECYYTSESRILNIL